MFIALFLTALALTVFAVVRRSLAPAGSVDLGSVSHQWLAEYRADEQSSPSR